MHVVVCQLQTTEKKTIFIDKKRIFLKFINIDYCMVSIYIVTVLFNIVVYKPSYDKILVDGFFLRFYT